jgi:putative membrane protein
MHPAVQQIWTAAHAKEGGWLFVLGQVAALLLLALLATILLRAFLRRKRYRAVQALDPAARQELIREIAAVERRTVGEVVIVVLERSDRHPGANLSAGLAMLLVGLALLFEYLPWSRAPYLLLSQALLFLLGFLLARLLPDFRRLFLSERRASEVAREQAFQEFYAAGLYKTRERTGVLLFVSLFEHRALVLGDEGIDAVVDARHWESSCDAILDGARTGDLAGGFKRGLALTSAVLAERFPWTPGDRDEVQDRVVVRQE